MMTHHGAEHTRTGRLRARLRRPRLTWLVPKEAQAHLQGAAREQLLAVRSLLDAAIDRLERQQKGYR